MGSQDTDVNRISCSSRESTGQGCVKKDSFRCWQLNWSLEVAEVFIELLERDLNICHN